MKFNIIYIILTIGLAACTLHEHKNGQALQGAQDSPHHLMLTDTQLKLANITTEKVSTSTISQSMVVNAQLKANENQTTIISSRAAGRIERLAIKETGQKIHQGQFLYELYSEELLTLQKEYLLAKQQFETLHEPRYESFYRAAEKKLMRYGFTQNQLHALTQANVNQARVSFTSPATGIITEIKNTEGQYVSEGAALYKLENISTLWVEAELYPEESRLLNPGDIIRLIVTGYESSPVAATVDFMKPAYEENSQVALIRATINNPDLKFQPGMQAQVLMAHSSHKALVLPADAIIRDGETKHVYVQTEKNSFEPRLVKTGLEDFGKTEILEGLREGEIVAITGAYLLYSEFILKHGINPVTNHAH